jgi:asparagine synthase (glutamine-hydrolysing)
VLLGRLNDNVRHTITKYWDFDPAKRIRYLTDTEYEEHFRSALAIAVKRRLRSDRPVLAELSGGMDSSSIVCVADSLIACGDAECPRLDTVSWFDSSNPNWDDPVYFAKVEEKRGCIGCHIDLCSLDKDASFQKSLAPEFDNNRFAATAVPRSLSEHFKQYLAYMMSRGHRVTLSGIGGEQPTGGCTPTPMPELQNLLARARFFTLARQLRAWAAKMRKPSLQLFGEALQGFLPPAVVGLPEYIRPAARWLHPGFIRRNRAALSGYSSGLKLFGPLPSFQEHLRMLDCERRVMESFLLYPELLREARYPYHDRDFREFAYAIPCEQVVRVGQRRSLMRRALVGIVPDELLNRKQKSFFPETKKKNSREWPSLVDVRGHTVGTSIGIIDPDRFSEALQKAHRSEEVHLDELKRTLTLESWLRHLTSLGVLQNSSRYERIRTPVVSCGSGTPTAHSTEQFS